MSNVISFNGVASISAVQQTLARLVNAADYIAQVCPENTRAREVRDLSLDPSSLQQLKSRALRDPPLRAGLQAETESWERSIGVGLPLRISVSSEMAPERLPERGIGIFLTTPENWREAVSVPSALQVFTLTPAFPPEDEPVRIDAGRSLRDRGHSPAVRNHFAREAIEELAAYELSGERVTALSSPMHVFLSERITRVGRFSFLGLAETTDLPELERHQNRIDVLVLGSLAVTEPSFADEAIEVIRPLVTLLPAAAAAVGRQSAHSKVVPVSSGSTATLDLNPVTQIITVSDGGRVTTRRFDRSARFSETLERIRPDVTRDLGQWLLGGMRSPKAGKRAQGAWDWAEYALNGAVPMALSYLKTIEADPYRHATVAAREEVLALTISDWTDRLKARETVPDQVWAFKELLPRSGLLERRSAPNHRYR